MKRLISILLVLTLVITASLTGCSAKKSDNSTDTGRTDAETQTSSDYANLDDNTQYAEDNSSAGSTDTETSAAYGKSSDGSGIDKNSTATADSTTDNSGVSNSTASTTAEDSAVTEDTASVPSAVYDSDRNEESDAGSYLPGEGLTANASSSEASEDKNNSSMYRYDCYIYPGYNNTEEYTKIVEAGYKDTFNNPLSTFSIDVDTASYANLRENINSGIIPQTDAVRIEEMLNYFDYDYEEPENGLPFSINTEIGKCPWNEENYLLVVGIKGKDIDKEILPKSNLVFLIDVSGSMDEPDKLPLLKNAFSKLTEELGENDRVSIVVYADNTHIVLDSARGNDKDRILDAIEGLSAGGSTGGAAGIDLAYRLAEENFIEGGNNRIILATDGDFNVGPSSVEDLEDIIAEKRESGIFLSVMGFGSGNLKDNKMETLADKGNGNYSYIDSVREAKKVLVDEMAGTILTIAKDVKIQIEFNPYSVAGYRLIGYENRALAAEDFRDDSVDAGELGAGHTVTAVYEIIPAGKNASSDLKYQEQSADIKTEYKNEISEVRLRYKDPDGETSKEIRKVISYQNTPVDEKMHSEDFYFASAVIEFGMILRNSEYIGTSTPDSVLSLAEKGLGEDKNGYRLEFMELVDTYEELSGYYGW